MMKIKISGSAFSLIAFFFSQGFWCARFDLCSLHEYSVTQPLCCGYTGVRSQKKYSFWSAFVVCLLFSRLVLITFLTYLLGNDLSTDSRWQWLTNIRTACVPLRKWGRGVPPCGEGPASLFYAVFMHFCHTTENKEFLLFAWWTACPIFGGSDR